MKIHQELPFDHCENCKEFILKTLQLDDNGSPVIVVRCKNEWLCRQLKDNLKKEVGTDENGR